MCYVLPKKIGDSPEMEEELRAEIEKDVWELGIMRNKK